MIAVVIVGALSVLGIVAYLVSCYRFDRRQAESVRIVDLRSGTQAVTDAERIVRDAYSDRGA